MKEILQNIATLELLRYCKDNNIDPSDTYTYKYPRQWIYALVNNETDRAVVTVSLCKNRVPSFTIHN